MPGGASKLLPADGGAIGAGALVLVLGALGLMVGCYLRQKGCPGVLRFRRFDDSSVGEGKTSTSTSGGEYPSEFGAYRAPTAEGSAGTSSAYSAPLRLNQASSSSEPAPAKSSLAGYANMAGPGGNELTPVGALGQPPNQASFA